MVMGWWANPRKLLDVDSDRVGLGPDSVEELFAKSGVLQVHTSSPWRPLVARH
jgi:hypothetical protein